MWKNKNYINNKNIENNIIYYINLHWYLRIILKIHLYIYFFILNIYQFKNLLFDNYFFLENFSFEKFYITFEFIIYYLIYCFL